MVPIKLKGKYRTQPITKSTVHVGTPNGGDAYLNKNKTKKKLNHNDTSGQRERSLNGMRRLVIQINGKRTWR